MRCAYLADRYRHREHRRATAGLVMPSPGRRRCGERSRRAGVIAISLSRDLVVMRLVTVLMAAREFDRAEAMAANPRDTPVAAELRRRLAAARQESDSQPESRKMMMANPEQAPKYEMHAEGARQLGRGIWLKRPCLRRDVVRGQGC
jgi:hypothetical protein